MKTIGKNRSHVFLYKGFTPYNSRPLHNTNRRTGQKALWSYLENQDLSLYSFESSDIQRMRFLMEQYRDVPMDLADASLVAAAEALNQRLIFTLDTDFYIYRFQGKLSFEVIP